MLKGASARALPVVEADEPEAAELALALPAVELLPAEEPPNAELGRIDVYEANAPAALVALCPPPLPADALPDRPPPEEPPPPLPAVFALPEPEPEPAAFGSVIDDPLMAEATRWLADADAAVVPEEEVEERDDSPELFSMPERLPPRLPPVAACGRRFCCPSSSSA